MVLRRRPCLIGWMAKPSRWQPNSSLALETTPERNTPGAALAGQCRQIGVGVGVGREVSRVRQIVDVERDVPFAHPRESGSIESDIGGKDDRVGHGLRGLR